MEKRTREKIVLVVFFLLVVFAGAVLVGYFTTGRTWNVAASFVDDTVGSMDGYTAIVYEGVIDPAADDDVDAESDGKGKEAADSKSSSSKARSANASDGVQDEGGASASDGSSNKGAEGKAASSSTSDASGSSSASSNAKADEKAGSAGEAGSDSGSAGSFGLDLLALLSQTTGRASEDVYPSEVRSLYTQKGAQALTLNLSDLERYAEPQVYEVGGKRIGVYSLKVYATRGVVADIRRTLEAQDVDVTICLTPRADFLSTTDGTDVVIVTTDLEGISTDGSTQNGAFTVASPERGSVGAVLLNPSNVASARVIKTL